MKSLLPLIPVLFVSLVLPVSAAGAHAGEAPKITATLDFLAAQGWSTTDSSGITYYFGGTSTFEQKVYPAEYWGTFPGYYYGTTMHYHINLNSNMPQGKKPYKIKVQAISNVLNETVNGGGLGAEIGTSETWEVIDLLSGQAQTLTGTVVIPNDGSLPSGLNVTRIIISHLNNANDPDEDDSVAGLVDVTYNCWCPPPLATLASQNSSASRLAQQWRSERNGIAQLLPSSTARSMAGVSHGQYPWRRGLSCEAPTAKLLTGSHWGERRRQVITASAFRFESWRQTNEYGCEPLSTLPLHGRTSAGRNACSYNLGDRQ
jgi:hypothetical protein